MEQNKLFAENKPAPFLKYNTLPDKCVVDFINQHRIGKACEFGCGEERNAIYLAKNNIDVDAYDLSDVAIGNAKKNAAKNGAEKAHFHAKNIFALVLLCFAAGEDGADEINDYEFYRSRQTGTAFTEERLREFWGEKFDIAKIRKGENIVDSYMWENEFLYICLLKKI